MLDERGLAGRENRLGHLIDGFRKEETEVRKWQGLMNPDEHERYLRSLATLLQALEGARSAVSAACDRLSELKKRSRRSRQKREWTQAPEVRGTDRGPEEGARTN